MIDTAEVMMYIEEYVSFFNDQYVLLKERYDRFKELRSEKGWCLDTETYIDMIIVQLRSIMIENTQKGARAFGNYTIQSILSITEDENNAKKIDELLNTILIPGANGCDECLVGDGCLQNIEGCLVRKSLTIKLALKIIADKTICHYDNYYSKGCCSWDCIRMIKWMLYEQQNDINIDYIMNTLSSIFHDGVKVSYDIDEDVRR